jgi:hypothetical protein
MPPYDPWREDGYRESRPAGSRRRRATTGVVIIDDEITWSAPPTRPRRVSGPIDGYARARAAEFDTREPEPAYDQPEPGFDEPEPSFQQSEAGFYEPEPDFYAPEAAVGQRGPSIDEYVGEVEYVDEVEQFDERGAYARKPSRELAPTRGGGERRTVVITGRVADRYVPSTRRGYEANLRPHERSSFKPDRMALWAVLMGVLLLLVAATSSHAATLAAHLPH